MDASFVGEKIGRSKVKSVGSEDSSSKIAEISKTFRISDHF